MLPITKTFNSEVCCNVFFHSLSPAIESANHITLWFLLLLFCLHIFICQICCVCLIFKVSFKLISAVYLVRHKRIKNKKEKNRYPFFKGEPSYSETWIFPLLPFDFLSSFWYEISRKKIFFYFWDFRMITEQNLILIEG